MIRILVVVPYEEMDRQVREYFAGIEARDFTVEIEHFIGTDDRLTRRRDADIIVARGMTRKALERSNPTAHVIEISIAMSDLVDALLQCRERFGGKGVGVVLTDTGICDAVQLQALMGMPIYLRKADDEADLYTAISDLYDRGVGCFVGGLTLCRRCDDLGLEYIHIKSGSDAMAKSLNEAVATARSLNRERTRTNLVSTLLNGAEDAMFAVNGEGVVIAANAQASALFLRDRAKPLEGRRIGELLPGAPEGGADPEAGMLETVGGQLALVKRTPIKMGDENLGMLVTCRNVEAIRETEWKIRSALGRKGLVARYGFGDILCESAAMKTLMAHAYKYSQADSSVFIAGETGTGKELFAQSIHRASRRADQPFVAVNCAALPEPLLESELFGYTEGAFSGAAKGGKIGLFELAHRGTIFLDEIGDMPPSIQAKILRVLEEKEIRRIGSDSVVPVDVRIVSAMNGNILDLVRKGAFRQDLYYRINLLNISIPPLRARPEDIEPLFRHFIRRFALKAGMPVPRIEPSAGAVLRAHAWRGNVRELRNFSERMVILNESALVDAAAVRAALDAAGADGACAEPERYESGSEDGAGDGARIDRARIEGARGAPLAESFAASGMDHGEFAASLGISRTTLWRRFRQERQGIGSRS